ncbi:SMP-30/gluconolactonase/LRE family protein [Novosphingobium malaysiense]|uniref:SMP-30/Gluconolactonase/LRE-like region domain-containing protein n=1 Tax=Novosphingobium malaysiense TaxID=1348853 RepID=A0A0B1ZD29_9SPHN|nr:SMP-30/gluconolactonase/LRE family protein [Novosphingobium malaysiense]KHK88959.1 hypothetical protein LK12_22965 [Novosphingobium malaysiense]
MLKPFDTADMQRWGKGLTRPEDVAFSRDGRTFATDPEFGACEILQDGSLLRICETPRPGCCNGISMDLAGNILIANLGAHHGVPGALEKLNPETGLREILLSEVEGRPLTSCNYPMADSAGNIWCSNSTARANFAGLAETRPHDGFIFVLRTDGTSSVVAEGLGFANGLAMSQDEQFLFCCQSFDSNVIRYPVLPGGQLGAGEQYGPLVGNIAAPGARADGLDVDCPDGCAFDQEGNLWVALYSSNKIVAITPSGELRTLASDPEGKILRRPANVTFGGPDLCDVYIGGLGMDYVIKLRSSVPGMPLAHQR